MAGSQNARDYLPDELKEDVIKKHRQKIREDLTEDEFNMVQAIRFMKIHIDLSDELDENTRKLTKSQLRVLRGKDWKQRLKRMQRLSIIQRF